jgi:hypothetical protein
MHFFNINWWALEHLKKHPELLKKWSGFQMSVLADADRSR